MQSVADNGGLRGETGSDCVTNPIDAIATEPFEALLFDLDGTLVDTMPLHYQAYAKVLTTYGLVLTEAAYMAAIGAPARVAIPQFIASAGGVAVSSKTIAAIHASKKDAFAAILHDEEPRSLPAAGLLQRVRARRRCGLVSSGNRAGVAAIIDKMGWNGWFAAVVTGDDVALGKPHPDPFLEAARLLDVAPASCLVFEDTADGLEAARRAGMRAIDVTRLPEC